MVTRKTASKTASKTGPARTTKTGARTEGKPAATAAKKHAAEAAPKKRRVIAAGEPTPAAPAAIQAPQAPTPSAEVPAGEARYRWIAHAAYLRAERRGFAPGQEVDDWLAAEAEFAAVFKTG